MTSGFATFVVLNSSGIPHFLKKANLPLDPSITLRVPPQKNWDLTSLSKMAENENRW